jgi:hypothetical protein
MLKDFDHLERILEKVKKSRSVIFRICSAIGIAFPATISVCEYTVFASSNYILFRVAFSFSN